ncbi:MAG TPA: ribose-5-phosphate isomerase RpiA [Polyangia bacterium]|nr:ribose-5-phosphate isomerase RpiA [Polyangia bacterium]
MNLDAARDRAALAAVAHIEDGMTVGLGSGDTAARAIRFLGARRLDIVGVATSERSAALARSVGIVVRAPDDVPAIDITIDGADELDDELRIIKGGGAAHTREKLVARASRQLIIVADAGKRVRRLGEHMPLPIEILPFGGAWTMARLRALGLTPTPRAGLLSDNGNLIVDCPLAGGVDVRALAAAIKALTGVVEHGLFLDEAQLAYVGNEDGVEHLQR